MSVELKEKLTHKLGQRARFGQPMWAHTTWGVGGTAWCICQVHSPEEAAFVVKSANEAHKPWMPLGLGSNLLVSDKGYSGVMLHLAGPLASIRQMETSLLAQGGAPLPTVVRFAARLGLSGMEWAAGIPATVGGAVATNAGARGSDMSQVVAEIQLLLPNGEIKTFAAKELPAGYRQRRLPPGSLLLNANLELRPDNVHAVEARTREFLDQRRSTQPLRQRTAGSVFKNPPGQYAGRLIEEAGCKGLSRGDAVVSQQHANFIENRGRARASEVLDLINEIRHRVQEKAGVDLEPEVELVGYV